MQKYIYMHRSMYIYMYVCIHNCRFFFYSKIYNNNIYIYILLLLFIIIIVIIYYYLLLYIYIIDDIMMGQEVAFKAFKHSDTLVDVVG